MRGVEIGTLRVRGEGEPLRLRLGLEGLLGSVDLVGTRLPPAAVLVVRTLRDPLPGRLDVTSPTPDRAWEQRVRDLLDDLVSSAARPAWGPADPGASAVIFTDRSELLACAWRECLRSGRPTTWWWRALRLDDVRRVVVALLESPGEVPAVTARLAASGDLAPAVRLLGEPEVVGLARSVAAARGRAELVSEVRERLDPAARRPASPGTGAAPTTSRARDVRSAGGWPDGGIGALPLAHAVLVEVCRVLAPPHLTRPVADPVPPPGESAAGPVPPAAPEAVWGTRTRRQRRVVRRPPFSTGPPRPRAPSPGPHRRLVLPPVAPSTGGEARLPSLARPSSLEPSPDHGPADRLAAPEVNRPAAREAEVVVTTRLGGVFHLVQVGQAAGLYGDFTTPTAPGIALDVWDFVALTSRALGAGLGRDPVWRLLADLAGRDPATPPGSGFRPRMWRAPRDWPVPAEAPGPWRRIAGESSAAARERWLRHLTSYLRLRLAGALAVPPSRAGRTLCRRPARVHVTPTRVDVVSELADHPIEVRLAGLDRDLGYVPAAGLTIGFEFR